MHYHAPFPRYIAFLLIAATVFPATLGHCEELHNIKLDSWIGGLVFTPDGKQLVAGVADNTAVLIDVETAQKLRVFEGHEDYVIGVAISPDGNSLATGSYDHTAAIWKLSSGALVCKYKGGADVPNGHRGVVMSVTFSPDGKTVATSCFDGDIRIWNSKTNQPPMVLKGHKSWVNSLVYTPDGNKIISGSSDGTVGVWDVASGKQLQSLRATKAEVRSVAVSPDGKQFAAGLRYGQVKAWRMDDCRLQLDFQEHREDVFAIAYLNNQVLATGDGGWNKPGEVKLWNCVTGKEIATLSHAGEVLSLAASRDGRTLAAGSGNGLIKIWHVDITVDE